MTSLRRYSGRRVAVAASLALCAASCSKESPLCCGPTPPAANTVTVNGAIATVAIAATRATREQGLMGVTKLAADSGMLFVFADDRQRFFWMKDTPTPLSIAFIDLNKKIVFIEDMAPNTLVTHGGPMMRYALEVNHGWFAAHAVTVGMTVAFVLPTGIVIEPDP